jgi:hypothetical protein
MIHSCWKMRQPALALMVSGWRAGSPLVSARSVRHSRHNLEWKGKPLHHDHLLQAGEFRVNDHVQLRRHSSSPFHTPLRSAPGDAYLVGSQAYAWLARIVSIIVDRVCTRCEIRYFHAGAKQIW